MKFKLFKRRRRSKLSPEAKSKAKLARTEAYLADVWLKMLKDNPELAQKVAEQKFGIQLPGSEDSDYGGYQPDLLEVLRQAKEAKDLVREELGESKGNWIKDVAEIMKNLPLVLRAMGQMKLPSGVSEEEKKPLLRQPEPEPEPEPEPKPEPEQLQAKVADLLPLLDLEPAQAYQELINQGQDGWIHYLSTKTFEEMLADLELLVSHPQYGEEVRQFIEEKRDWLQQLSLEAHKNAGKTQ